MVEIEFGREIRRFVADNYIVDVDTSELPGHVSLTEAGILDSMGVLELVLFLEERYGLTVADEELIPENLDTVDRIVAFLGRKVVSDGSPQAGEGADPARPTPPGGGT